MDSRAGNRGTQPQAYCLRSPYRRRVRRPPGRSGRAVRPHRGTARRRAGHHRDRPGSGGAQLRSGRARPGRPHRRRGGRAHLAAAIRARRGPGRDGITRHRAPALRRGEPPRRGQDARPGRPRPGRRRLAGAAAVAPVHRHRADHHDHRLRHRLPAPPARPGHPGHPRRGAAAGLHHQHWHRARHFGQQAAPRLPCLQPQRPAVTRHDRSGPGIAQLGEQGASHCRGH